MTKAQIKRLLDAALEVAQKNGVQFEVTIDGATVRLAPDDKPVAEAEEIVL
jgi:hypothetical protein